jgi:D-alanyl-D-alanine carboxypeptidase (penicillin-binding protein 5/6)
MSLRDLATLATHAYEEFPQYSHYFSIPEFTYHNIRQQNRNPLIREHYDGTVGGKTGYTNDGGYGVIGVVKRDHRRLIAVVNKAKTPKQRMAILTNLFDYGFDNYKKLIIFEKNQEVTNLAVWLGKSGKIAVVAHERIAFNIPRDKPLSEVKVSVKYKGPLYAPVAKDSQVATLVVEVKGYKTFEYPLFAADKVEKVGDLRKIKRVLEYKFHNFFNKNFN